MSAQDARPVRWDCYAHVGAHRHLFARDLMAQMETPLEGGLGPIGRAALVPFLDAPSFDDLLDAAREHPDRFIALCRVDPGSQNLSHEGVAALLGRGFAGARVVLRDAGDAQMDPLLRALDEQGKVLLVHAPEGLGVHARRIAAWVARYQRLRVFVPHLGWPLAAQDAPLYGAPTPGWEDGLRALAACDHIYFGLSALYYFSRHAPPFEDAFPFVQSALQAFGPAHCVLAGDYPLTLQRCTYAQVWQSLAYAVGDTAALEWMWAKTPLALWGEVKE